MIDVAALDFAKGGGLVTVVTIDDVSGRVLMVAHADREALERTLATGEMHYRSRTRGLWHKGATSGNVQKVVALCADCDADAVLARVNPAGPACCEGTTSCFADGDFVLRRLDETIASRAMTGAAGYTRRLLDDSNLRLKKIGEEAAELVHAAALGDRDGAVRETADLLYHTLVVLRSLGAGLDDVARVLASREKSRATRSIESSNLSRPAVSKVGPGPRRE
jgi:phosphoribosyl-ATP pyrophosphohydrolase/phosphoribosyl-AMP cyclohydrolase